MLRENTFGMTETLGEIKGAKQQRVPHHQHWEDILWRTSDCITSAVQCR